LLAASWATLNRAYQPGPRRLGESSHAVRDGYATDSGRHRLTGPGGAVRNENLGSTGKILRSRPHDECGRSHNSRLSFSNASAEVTLYQPVKAFLERQGYVVRDEVRGCDLVARRGNEEPVIVEQTKRRLFS
jgi:hypothetical protein